MFFQPDLAHPDFLDSVHESILYGEIGPGKWNEAFAKSIKDYTGANHVLLTTSGSVALYLIFKYLLDFKPRCVGVPAYGEIATASAISAAGYDVHPIDINLKTGCLDVDAVRCAIGTDMLGAVCFVNFSGSTPGKDLKKIRQLCAGAPLGEVFLVEDAACAIGHWSEGQHAGTFADYAILSFSPHKHVTTGQGGAVLLRHKADYEHLKSVIAHGNKGEIAGMNYRMSDINAALGLAQMERLEEILQKRSAQFANLQRSMKLWCPDSGPPVHNITFNEYHRGRKNYKLLSEYPVFARHTNMIANSCSNARVWAETARYQPFGLGQS